VDERAMPNYLDFINTDAMIKVHPEGVTMIH
jgi:hypothetical protein